MWNAPGQPDGATHHQLSHPAKINDGAWETLISKTATLHTDYTDPKELMTGEVRMYRVAAFSGNNMGAWATVYYPAMAHDPGMPTGVMAEKVAAMPTSQIKVSWSAPASGVVDGYNHRAPLWRRHDGHPVRRLLRRRRRQSQPRLHELQGMVGDPELQGYARGCRQSETPAAEGETKSADEMMYCAHFANTAPTSMAFEGKTLSEATAMRSKSCS